MLKNNAIVGNIGHFDSEIDFADSEESKGIKVATSTLRSGFRPARTTSTSCQEVDVKRVEITLSFLTQGQAASTGVKVESPFRSEHYCY